MSQSPTKTKTFRTTIDADHDTITALASRLRKAYAAATPTLTLGSQLTTIKDELIWRLIRHDNSEDLVMRPAFIKYLGAKGRSYVERDRHDHGDAKHQLVPLLPLSPTSDEFKRTIISILTELKGHMDRESGHELPRFESILSRDTSQRLAELYDRTLILTPVLTWGQLRHARERDSDAQGEFNHLKPGKDSEKVFTDLRAYVFTSSEKMRQLLGWPGDLLGESGKDEGETGPVAGNAGDKSKL